MGQYYFHLCDGHEVIIDPEGRSLPDPALIAEYALKEARAMISQDALSGRIILNQYIEVRDESGRLVHQLSFRDAVTIKRIKKRRPARRRPDGPALQSRRRVLDSARRVRDGRDAPLDAVPSWRRYALPVPDG